MSVEKPIETQQPLTPVFTLEQIVSILDSINDYDQLLGDSLGMNQMMINKLRVDYPDAPMIKILEAGLTHTVQIFLKRHNAKLQITNKFINDNKSNEESTK
jgi:hypothetical protein